MPKAPITINIAPSKLALALHVVLILAVVAQMLLFSALWLAILVFLLTGGILFDWWRRQRRWALRQATTDGMGNEWQVCSEGSNLEWRPARLQVFYLGPWLIGITLDGGWRRVWIWPDSASTVELRELRRRLLAEKG